MVNPMRKALLGATLAAAGLGCTAEFGGRCAETAECSGEYVCIQGYCLPADSTDAVDGGPQSDGGAEAGEPPPLDGVIFGESCRFDAVERVPAYDPEFRPCADPDTAALWRFDDDFEALLPPGGSPVALAGTPDANRVRIDAAGASGGAAVFDGAGDPQLDFDSPIRATPPLTIELWARPSGQDTDSRTLVGNLDVDRDGNIAGGFELFIDQSDADPGRYVLGLAYAAGRDRRSYESAATFPVDRWVHLAASIDTDRMVRLYVDGVQEAVGPIESTGRGRDLLFGRRSEGGDLRPYPGALDEVRLSTVVRDGETLRRVAEGFTRPD